MAGWRRFARDERTRGFVNAKAKEMREAMTPAEKRLSESLNAEWKRQEPLCSIYIADFVHYPCKLVIELDGEYHNDPAQSYRDARRDRTMEAFGFEVMRFPNATVFGDLPSVVAAIDEKMKYIRKTRYIPKSLP